MTRGALAAALALVLTLGACSAHAARPTKWQWGIPIYPGAALQTASSGKASFAVYSTGDDLTAVDAWYAAELPPGTPHAANRDKAQTTFAIFSAHSRRTVHLTTSGSGTLIAITSLNT